MRAALTWPPVTENDRWRTRAHRAGDAEGVAGAIQHDFVRPRPQCRSQPIVAHYAGLRDGPGCAGGEQSEYGKPQFHA